MPSCSKLHVCMLRQAAVLIVASGIVGRIVFICTRQYSSVFLANGSTISFTKFLPAAVRKHPYRRVLLSVSFVLRPSRSVTKLFCTTHHLTCCLRVKENSAVVARITAFNHCCHPSFATPFQCYCIIRSALRDPRIVYCCVRPRTP